MTLAVERDVKPQLCLTHFGSLDFISGFVKFLVEAQSVILNNSS